MTTCTRSAAYIPESCCMQMIMTHAGKLPANTLHPLQFPKSACACILAYWCAVWYACVADSEGKSCKSCIQKLKHGKSPGIDGVSAVMLIDGHELLHNCLLQLFNRMLAIHFPECLSVDMFTAVYKSGGRSNMSNYRGITVGPALSSCLQ